MTVHEGPGRTVEPGLYRSISVTHRGGIDAIRIEDHPIRPPNTGEARVRVLTSAVCQDDIAARIGNRPFLRRPPFVPGYSFVGVVDAMGPESPTDVAVGDRVTALTRFGSHAEFVYWPAKDLAPVPGDIDPVMAAPLVLNYLVAQQILHRVAGVRPGDRVLIIGASGGVGTALLQLGAVAGLEMYGTASRAKHDLVHREGATPIDYRTEDVAETMRRHEPDGIDFVFNGMGPDWCGPGIATLRRGGMVVHYGAPESPGGLVVLLTKFVRYNLTPNGRKIKGYGTHREGVESFKEDWATLFALLRSGAIRPVVARTFPMLEAAEAYEMLESGRVAGNLVLVAPDLGHSFTSPAGR